MPRRTTDRAVIPSRVLAVARRQGGAVSHAQLLTAGLGRMTISRWVDDRRLHPEHVGVFGLGRPLDDALGTIWAAALAVGRDAVVSHASLQVLLGTAPFDRRARPHVTVPRRSGIEQPRIVVHRVRRLDPQDVTTLHGLRCTTPARLLLDEAERLRTPALRRLVRELKVRRLLPEGAVEDVIARSPGRRGLRRLRAVWDTTSGAVARTASVPEGDLLRLCRASGLPEPLMNETVRGAERGWRADALFPAERLVVEIDSWRCHGFDDAFEDDHRKDEDLRAAGFGVLRFTAARLAGAPAAIAAAIGRELALRRVLLATPPDPLSARGGSGQSRGM